MHEENDNIAVREGNGDRAECLIFLTLGAGGFIAVAGLSCVF